MHYFCSSSLKFYPLSLSKTSLNISNKLCFFLPRKIKLIKQFCKQWFLIEQGRKTLHDDQVYFWLMTKSVFHWYRWFHLFVHVSDTWSLYFCWQGYPAILCMPTLPQASSPLLVSTAQTSHKFHGTYHRRLIRKCLRNDWTHLVSLWTILRFDVSLKCFTTPSQQD